ncbi:MAG: glycosyltransferase family 2 protein [Prevotella sp.]|nr:glycosyltransferase family 2 protein [Prevotella sp.]
MWTAIHIIDIVLWVIMALSVVYVAFFALVSVFHRKKKEYSTYQLKQSSFLILYPAYKEDAVIQHSVRQFLEQNYPKDLFQVAVISDHMKDDTNLQLSQLPITLHTLTFDKSSKARALQYAMQHTEKSYDYVVILDADNVVLPDFLEQLNASCQKSYQAIQCHRCAKNSDNNIAVLDGASEEINNTIFRKAHNTVGLSSALIGSGMCFAFEWFKHHVNLLNSAVEDRELESHLLQEKVYIKFEENIHVFDEKVSNRDNFERQRLRWLNGQLQTLLIMLPNIPHAIASGNINYIDKTIQQALIPRSILLVLIPIFSLIMLLLAPVWSIKWWALFLVLCISLYIAIPARMRNSTVFGKLTSFPRLALKMLKNLFRLNKNNKDFLHTTHGE